MQINTMTLANQRNVKSQDKIEANKLQLILMQ